MARPRPKYGPCSDCGAEEEQPCRALKTRVGGWAKTMKTVHKGRPKLPPPLSGKARAEALIQRIAEREAHRAFLL